MIIDSELIAFRIVSSFFFFFQQAGKAFMKSYRLDHNSIMTAYTPQNLENG